MIEITYPTCYNASGQYQMNCTCKENGFTKKLFCLDPADGRGRRDETSEMKQETDLASGANPYRQSCTVRKS